MTFANEFCTVELLRNSTAETRAVDAFSLALIKSERQIRKIVTHLVFQYPCFSTCDVNDLKQCLADNRRIYFAGMLEGFDAIWPRSVENILGEKHEKLKGSILEAIGHRNKIFHGQLTQHNLSRPDLFIYVDNISEWCSLLSTGAEREFGFDGFTRNSYKKSSNNELHNLYKTQLDSLDDYRVFIADVMQR